MKLQEIFDQLTYGEFSQLAIGGNAPGVIDEFNYANVLGHVNLGLTALFTRFKLKEGRTVVPLMSTQPSYPLTQDDLIKIERVLTDDELELSLNVESDPYSCFTPSMKVLRVPQVILDQSQDLPDCYKTDALTVVYRANHPKLALKYGILFPEKIDIELPATHLQALLFFVASRVHNPIGMGQEFNAGNTYYAKYENECRGLEGQGVQVDQGDQNTRLFRNGWV